MKTRMVLDPGELGLSKSLSDTSCLEYSEKVGCWFVGGLTGAPVATTTCIILCCNKIQNGDSLVLA